MKLHEKIRAVRKAKNISQIVISNKLNITVQSYSMKETGKRPITTNELEIISNILGVSPSNFFDKEFNKKLNKTTA
ncbi:helix-turn-helix domain-containing protein [Cytobacillus oceanisediminis]|uniref:helix-turn-helix domain-containing protein n=1 Tax=Cytobacillus oceanisediminis TaxID=665099 RepID=UPI001C243C1B|nr:helix-turn-helix transcriptional regulator [Cytobacillus oceanisediminis]MBU8732359.1 helix-turn-helix domain-containing protein [Cytobacillus oceanisediminis]MDK7666539.1 helix-turn-helix transcriptional regulator [Cytobacillus oceanisediminis]